MEELKPCPFCGGRAFVTIGKGKQYKAIFVECEDCEARLPIAEHRLISFWKPNSVWKTNLERAMTFYGNEIIEAWNNRAGEDDE